MSSAPGPASPHSRQRLPGNMSVEQLAGGIIEIANWSQANAHPPDDDPARHRSARLRAAVVRRRRAGAVRRGDGSARHEGLHRAAESRQSLGLRPARGRLAHRSHRHQGDARGCDRSCRRRRALCRRWSATPIATLERDGIEASRIRLVREADIRYAGQSMEVRVTAPGGAVDASFLAGLIDAFNAAHLQDLRLRLRRPAEGRAGQSLRLRLRSDRTAADAEACRRAAAIPPRKGSRPVYFGGEFRDTPVYDRAIAAAG